MLLFAGLGNPGPRYSGNRHNIGFLAVDAISRRHRFGPWRRRFQGETAEGEIAGQKILLLKPETFMNESGHAVLAAQNFYKIALKDVVVFHEEDVHRGVCGGAAHDDTGFRSVHVPSPLDPAACSANCSEPVVRSGQNEGGSRRLGRDFGGTTPFLR